MQINRDCWKGRGVQQFSYSVDQPPGETLSCDLNKFDSWPEGFGTENGDVG